MLELFLSFWDKRNAASGLRGLIPVISINQYPTLVAVCIWGPKNFVPKPRDSRCAFLEANHRFWEPTPPRLPAAIQLAPAERRFVRRSPFGRDVFLGSPPPPKTKLKQKALGHVPSGPGQLTKLCFFTLFCIFWDLLISNPLRSFQVLVALRLASSYKLKQNES